MNTLNNAYELIEKLNANIKVVEEAEMYKGVLDGNVKLAAVERVNGADFDNITYLPIDEEDMAELKEFARKLIMKKADAANKFLESAIGQKAPEVVVAKMQTTTEVNEAEIVKWHDEDGLTFDEIGSRLGCSKSTAHKKYTWAKVGNR